MEYPSEKEARALIVEAGHKLIERKLAERTWGNISMKIGDDEFIITPSGRSYEDMKTDDLPVVSIKDLAWKGPYKPSSEKGMHAEIYKVRPDAACIIHTHQDAGSIVSISDRDFGEYPSASYAMSSTSSLAKSVSQTFSSHPASSAVLMPHHGVVTIGRTLEDAFDEAERLEVKAVKEVERALGDVMSSPIDYGTSRRDGDGFICTFSKGERSCSLSETKFPFSLHAAIYRRYKDINFIQGVVSPYVAAVAAQKRTIHPSIDDLAMIAGSTIRYADREHAVNALKGRNAVYLPGGAIVMAAEEDDIGALLSLLVKGSQAELYRIEERGRSVPYLSAIIERFVYVKKYSKKKR